MRALFLFLVLAASARGETPAPAPTPIPTQRVGQNLLLSDVYIPGGEVKPTPRRDRAPSLSVRLLDTKPAKDGFRYDFEIQGFDPGVYDLANFLTASDPANPPVFPKIPLEIKSQLPPGILLPHELEELPLPALGGYRKTLVILGVVWVIGFGIFIFSFRKKKVKTDSIIVAPSAAQRLLPLVRAARSKQLDSTGQAQMERLIIGYWRERLPEMGQLPPAEALGRLKSHPEASPLLRALEEWLHARHPSASDQDIEKLLAPYQ